MAKLKSQLKKRFSWWGWGLLAVAVVVIAGAGIVLSQASQSANRPPLPKEIMVTEAAQRRNQGAYFLDVREPDEWTQQHIPGATLIPLGSLQSRVNEVPKDREIVVVCRSGNRSQQGRDILLNAGFTAVTSMAGGVNQWFAQGLPIATGK